MIEMSTPAFSAPWAMLPWQGAQLRSYAFRPAASDSGVAATGFFTPAAPGSLACCPVETRARPTSMMASIDTVARVIMVLPSEYRHCMITFAHLAGGLGRLMKSLVSRQKGKGIRACGSRRLVMKTMRLVLAMTIVAAWAAPAAAQRYTATQNGELVELADTNAQMNVSVVWSMSNAWRIQVKRKDLVRTSATLADFQARPGFNGMPILAPFANRLDETAFYANGKKYNFDLDLGNVRGPIPSTGYVNGSKAWQLVEAKADQRSAWVTCRL